MQHLVFFSCSKELHTCIYVHHAAYMKTSLRPYMEFFRDRFLNPLIQDNNTHKRKGNQENHHLGCNL